MVKTERAEIFAGNYKAIMERACYRFYCTTRTNILTSAVSTTSFWVREGWCWYPCTPRRSRWRQRWGQCLRRAGNACCAARVPWEACSATPPATACPSAGKTSPHTCAVVPLSTTQTAASKSSIFFMRLFGSWSILLLTDVRHEVLTVVKCRRWSSGLGL